jgi:putative cardiolipin synthase
MRRFPPQSGAVSRTLVAVLLLLAAAGCATVDFDYPRTTSTALTDTGETRLGRLIQPDVASNPGQSGFHLLIDGFDALAARLRLAAVAERSIDAQYYLITDDPVGYVFIGALLSAADRGVRVRLLLDDIQTKGYDAGMAALDSHPNFEVRIFNPFAGRGSRVWDGLSDFGRINRRMHNKSFTADNQITIIGGRNIAAEYFGGRKDVNFGDVDVMSIGPVVSDVSAMFDTYWNDPAAAPVPAFARMPDDPAAALERLRATIAEKTAAIRESQYADAVRTEYAAYGAADTELFSWAPYRLAWDAPEKARRAADEDSRSIVKTLAAAVGSAERELVVISPYFVPRKSGIEYLRRLRERGIAVTVITNSLAANNHAIVHAGYAPSRKPLLELGVKLYEVRADRAVAGVERGGAGASLSTLHTKAFIVDRDELFIGSFNWDPRSVNLNTELGVIIESPELAGAARDRVDEFLGGRAYEVILDDRGRVRWLDRSGYEERILDKEPNTGWWRRFSTGFMRILPVRGQL